MVPKHTQYDVLVVGGGIGGTTAAAVLARIGLRVLIVEGGTHPRFAIGESAIPELSLLMRVVGERFDVPEISLLSTYQDVSKNITTSCGVKRNFTYVHHREGEPADPRQSNQLPTFAPPLGPDCHYFRQDIDAWLYQIALSYGADGVTAQKVTSIDIDDDGVVLSTEGGQTYTGEFVIDAGGMQALLPRQLGLRENPARFKTRSRSIFTHMIGVESWDRLVGGKKAHDLPSPTTQGTLHHIFDGGWLWVIPFDNDPRSTNSLASVGLTLDLDAFPYTGEDPETEFWEIVSRFPDMLRQLRGARAVRQFMGSASNQFSSTQLTGGRWAVMPHASDFVDPLFSSGLSLTFWTVNALVPRIAEAVRTKDFDPARFAFIEEWVRKCFAYYDDLVGTAYIAFRDFRVWNAYSRIWMINSLYGNNGLMGTLCQYRDGNADAWDRMERAPYRGVQSVDNEHCMRLFEAVVAEVRAYGAGSSTPDETAARIYEHIAASGLAPDPLALTEPENRCPAGTFSTLPMLKLLIWGRRRAPKHVRDHYFDAGPNLVVPLLIDVVVTEFRRSIGMFARLIRDTFGNGWNKDWKNARPMQQRISDAAAPAAYPAPSLVVSPPDVPAERSADDASEPAVSSL